MIRNYAVTLSPITFRILLQVWIAMGLAPSPTVIAFLLWLSWALPLLIVEAVFRIKDLRRAAFGGHAPERTRIASEAAT